MGNKLMLNVLMDDESRGDILALIREQIQPALTSFVATMVAPEELEKSMQTFLKNKGMEQLGDYTVKRLVHEVHYQNAFREQLDKKFDALLKSKIERTIDEYLDKHLEMKMREALRRTHLSTTITFDPKKKEE